MSNHAQCRGNMHLRNPRRHLDLWRTAWVVCEARFVPHFLPCTKESHEFWLRNLDRNVQCLIVRAVWTIEVARSGSLSRVRLDSLDNLTKKIKQKLFLTYLAPNARALNSCDFHTRTLQMPAICEYLSLSFHSVLLGLFVSLKNHLKSGVSFHFHWPSRPCLRSWCHFWGKFAYLQEPLPTPLNALRSTIYSSLVPVANTQNLSWSWMLMASIQRSSVIINDWEWWSRVAFFVWSKALCEVKNIAECIFMLFRPPPEWNLCEDFPDSSFWKFTSL